MLSKYNHSLPAIFLWKEKLGSKFIIWSSTIYSFNILYPHVWDVRVYLFNQANFSAWSSRIRVIQQKVKARGVYTFCCMKLTCEYYQKSMPQLERDWWIVPPIDHLRRTVAPLYRDQNIMQVLGLDTVHTYIMILENSRLSCIL
jgi:hypothetical protein